MVDWCEIVLGLNRLGQVVGWHWLPMKHSDQDFLPLVELMAADGVVLADLDFRCKAGIPANLKLCLKGTWNDRMRIENAFSLLTVVCHAKQMLHRSIKLAAPTLLPCLTF